MGQRTAKETINKMKRQSIEWERILIFANDTTDKELISKIYKQLTQLNIKNTTQSIFQFKMTEQKDMCSSPPARAPKVQLAVEQPSTGGCWNLPKKDTSRPQTKKKPQKGSRRGTITIKSNPILDGWVTHILEKNNTKEVLPLLCSEPYISLPSLGL